MAGVEAGSRWSASAYNIVVPDGQGVLLFNAVTCAILRLSGTQWAFVSRCLHGPHAALSGTESQLAHQLRLLGFLVATGTDEYERERRRYHAEIIDPRRMRLTVAPTMRCNLHCTYCFQQNTQRSGPMSAEMQTALVEFVARRMAGTDELVVQWFGGEPLAAYDTMLWLTERFQQICHLRGAAYHAEMLTNGVLLTPRMIRTLGRISLKAIQLTLDGSPATFARRKGVSLDKAADFYEFIATHLREIVDQCGSVTLRINVDKDNIDEAASVVGLLKARGANDPRIDIRLGFLNTSRGVIDYIPHDCFSESEFAEAELAFCRLLASEGFRVYGTPEPRKYPCTAPLKHSYTVDPEGRIGKCVPATGTEQTVFGRIYPADLDRTFQEIDTRDYPFHDFDPFADQVCSECKLLPLCLGSCPKMHEPGATLRCSMKEGLRGKLALYSDLTWASSATGAGIL